MKLHAHNLSFLLIVLVLTIGTSSQLANAQEGLSIDTFQPSSSPESIFELVLHMIAWRNVARRRLEGERVQGVRLAAEVPQRIDALHRQCQERREDPHRDDSVSQRSAQLLVRGARSQQR